MKKNYDIEACSIGDLWKICTIYKVIIRLKRKYVGEQPSLVELIRTTIIHKMWWMYRYSSLSRQLLLTIHSLLKRLCKTH